MKTKQSIEDVLIERMTNLKQLVPTLETCKELKAVGFNIKTHCGYWYGVLMTGGDDFNGYDEQDICAAPLSDELLAVLPATITNSIDTYGLRIKKFDNAWNVSYLGATPYPLYSILDESPPEALAQTYLHLKERNLIWNQPNKALRSMI